MPMKPEFPKGEAAARMLGDRLDSRAATTSAIEDIERVCHLRRGSPHCFHSATLQHKAENHDCQVCCWCGLNRCVTIAAAVEGEHGRWLPQ